MSDKEIKITMSPSSYTLNFYKGIRCLCLSSKHRDGVLIYIRLTEECLSFFSPDQNVSEMNNVVNFLTLFNHMPYTIVDITGYASIEKKIYFFSKITNWLNSTK